MKRLRSFELINYTVEVIYQGEVFKDGERVFGLCDPMKSKIYVATKNVFDDTDLCEDAISHNTQHEVAHFKMFFVDEKFYYNEKKIDLLGALQAQVMKTSVYE